MKTMPLEQKNTRVSGLFTGFVVAFLLVNGGDFLFVRIYKHFESDFVPIVYMLIILLAMILTNLYMFYQYRYFPIFIRNSLKESIMTSFAGIVLIWIVVVFEVILYFGNQSDDPFVQHLIALPSPQFYIGLIMMIFISPFFEEILMRGFFFEILKRRWNIVISLLIIISFSSIMHYRVGIGVIHIILTNIIFTFLYLNGGLLSSILAHSFVNYYAVYFLNK
jgi:membrane protease YdiL (CAAX protease family)